MLSGCVEALVCTIIMLSPIWAIAGPGDKAYSEDLMNELNQLINLQLTKF